MAVMPIGKAELSLEPPISPATGRAETNFLRPMLGRLADLVLPLVCIACRRRIGSHGLLCGACFASIDFIAPPLCARRGIPLPYEAGERFRRADIASPPVYDRDRATARYSDTMRDLIQSFKYRDRHEGLPVFASWPRKAGAELLADADLIVRVLLYPAWLWRRRFNQSAMLAYAVGRFTGIPVDCSALRRMRRTASQIGLTADQRRRNVRGAFKVGRAHRSRVKEKTSWADRRGLRAGVEAGRGGAGRRLGAGARRRADRLRALALALDGLSAQLP
jgi:predicted amidophosphoribosyltransferase